MTGDVPGPFDSIVEVDETYIAGQWRNQPWSIRRYGTKRGRGTNKQAVFGLFERQRGLVRAFLVPNVQQVSLLPIIDQVVLRGSTIHSDAYSLYRNLPRRGYTHEFVDHEAHEYARGTVHTNNIEGFCGYLKRRLKTTGGIRRTRLHLYVAEEVWRFNNRKLPENEQINRLLCLIREKFGG
jgi:transposase-like protein